MESSLDAFWIGWYRLERILSVVWPRDNQDRMTMSDGERIRTALYDEHVALGGNIVDFHGFECPLVLEHQGISTENLPVSDVSHMRIPSLKCA